MDTIQIKKKRKIHFVIFFTLMAVVFAQYIIIGNIVEKIVAERNYQRELAIEYTAHWEYVKTKDCAPIIDEYGLNKTYLLEFDVKTTQPATVIVNFQNGYGAKYAFMEKVEATCEYQHFKLYVIPTMGTTTETEAFLAFSAPYGTGIIPTVTNIIFKPME